VNPIAGGNSKTEFLESLEHYADLHGFSYELYVTTGEQDRAAIEKRIEQYQPEKVIAVGGDGTLLMVAETIMHTDIRLGIVPAGSANGMAAELNIPSDPDEAMQVIFEGRCIRIDNLKVNGKYNCIHIGDMGLNAKVVHRFEKEKRRGLLGYARQFFREMPLSNPAKAIITTEKGRFVKKAHMIAFANARRYGTKALLNPIGRLDDGYFELCVIKSLSFKALFYILLSVFNGALYRTRYARIIRCQWAEIKLKKKNSLPVQVDGEFIGEYNQVRVEIEPRCLRVMVPANLEPSFWDEIILDIDHD
jgi:YegS/Rv2252/BmrU family lipid kinase